jgi:hypothetical protein
VGVGGECVPSSVQSKRGSTWQPQVKHQIWRFLE